MVDLPVYKCPYCDEFESVSKTKVVNHIYAKSDDKHGKRGTAPKDFTTDLIVEVTQDKQTTEPSQNEEPTTDVINTEELNDEMTFPTQDDVTQSTDVSDVTPETYTTSEKTKPNNDLEIKLQKLNAIDINKRLDDLKMSINVLETTLDEIITDFKDLKNRVAELENKVNVHKEAIVKILDSLGVD